MEEARERAAAATAAAPAAALTRELEAANRALAAEVSALRAAAAIAEHGPGNPRVAELEAANAALTAQVASLQVDLHWLCLLDCGARHAGAEQLDREALRRRLRRA